MNVIAYINPSEISQLGLIEVPL